MKSKKGFSVSSGAIVSLVLVIIMLTVLVSVAEDVIPTGATAYHNLSDTLAADSAVLGTDAASFAGDTDDYLGWFWVLGPFVLVLMAIVGIFMKGRR